jgi:hypothetical protein
MRQSMTATDCAEQKDGQRRDWRPSTDSASDASDKAMCESFFANLIEVQRAAAFSSVYFLLLPLITS